MQHVIYLILPGIMKNFWQNYPKTNVEINSYPGIEILDQLIMKHDDIEIVNLPNDYNKICIHSTFDLKLTCIMTESHPSVSKDNPQVKDL